MPFFDGQLRHDKSGAASIENLAPQYSDVCNPQSKWPQAAAKKKQPTTSI
jgi:hypothetical protein